MSTQARALDDPGGAISIGNEEEDQDPVPDGEALPEEDEPEDEARDPDLAGDGDPPRRN